MTPARAARRGGGSKRVTRAREDRCGGLKVRKRFQATPPPESAPVRPPCPVCAGPVRAKRRRFCGEDCKRDAAAALRRIRSRRRRLAEELVRIAPDSQRAGALRAEDAALRAEGIRLGAPRGERIRVGCGRCEKTVSVEEAIPHRGACSRRCRLVLDLASARRAVEAYRSPGVLLDGVLLEWGPGGELRGRTLRDVLRGLETEEAVLAAELGALPAEDS